MPTIFPNLAISRRRIEDFWDKSSLLGHTG
jgi:hypothetical protein